MQVETVSLNDHIIKPHAILGNKVLIHTRNLGTPHPKKDEKCDTIFYVTTTQDNTEATIINETFETCINYINLMKNKDSKVSGKKIIIRTKDRKGLRDYKVINKTHDHKAMEITTKDLTYCELYEEYSHILKSKDYPLLLSQKIEQTKSKN